MQSIYTILAVTRATRSNFRRIMDGLSLEQMNTIPEGFNNNILWNAGHVVATSLLLSYGLSGLEVPLGAELIPGFRKGTRPDGLYSQKELSNILALMDTTLVRLEQDYQAGIFKQFRPYETSYGVKLQTIEEGMNFNGVHEAMHLGNVLSMRKLV
ncbi:MAG: DinB family protein [Bacteroidota bacterium]